MTDISFVRSTIGNGSCDIEIENNDIKLTDSIETAVNILLLTDGRATISELEQANLFPSYPYDVRGWWGNAYGTPRIGSKLWLTRRRKATDVVKRLQEQYVREALNPLKNNGTIQEPRINTTWDHGTMEMSIDIPGLDETLKL